MTNNFTHIKFRANFQFIFECEWSSINHDMKNASTIFFHQLTYNTIERFKIRFCCKSLKFGKIPISVKYENYLDLNVIY